MARQNLSKLSGHTCAGAAFHTSRSLSTFSPATLSQNITGGEEQSQLDFGGNRITTGEGESGEDSRDRRLQPHATIHDGGP